jgi:hypothetical protein
MLSELQRLSEVSDWLVKKSNMLGAAKTAIQGVGAKAALPIAGAVGVSNGVGAARQTSAKMVQPQLG